MGERARAAREAMNERAREAKEAVNEATRDARDAVSERAARRQRGDRRRDRRGQTETARRLPRVGLLRLARPRRRPDLLRQDPEGDPRGRASTRSASRPCSAPAPSTTGSTGSGRSVRQWMRRLDHSMIFFLIAGTYTPFALLVMHGTLATAILVVVWAGAIAGAIVEMVWIGHPKWVSATVYLAIGWVAVAAFPELWRRARPDRRPAAGRRRSPLHGGRRRLRDPATQPEPGDLRLPRGLPRLRPRRRGPPFLGDRLLGAPAP